MDTDDQAIPTKPAEEPLQTPPPEPAVEPAVEPEPTTQPTLPPPPTTAPPHLPTTNPQLPTPEHKIDTPPTPVTELDKPAPKPPEPVATPQVSNIKPQISAADIVATLTDEQLKAAATLYTKRNQAQFSSKGVAKRKETMQLNLREIVDYLSLDNGAPLPRIAKHTNITLGTTSKYLRQLIASGKVRAKGWGKTRRYFLK